MTTPTHNLCIISDMSDDSDTLVIAGHSMPVKAYLQTKRLNTMLATELGVLCAATGMTHEEALKTVIQVVIKQLASRISAEDLSSFVGSVCKDFYAYTGNFPHSHLRRAELDPSYPYGFELKVSPAQFVLYNIVGKILRDDDALDGFWFLLKEAVLAYLMITRPVEFDDLSAKFGIPHPEPKEGGNVIAFGKVATDNSYDPFAQQH